MTAPAQPRPAHTRPDKPLLGIVLALGFCVVIPFSDALAKLLGERFPLLQLIQIRFAAQVLLCVPFVLWARARMFPSWQVAGLLFLRGLLQISGLAAMFTALRFLPLADAVAIAFVMPFLILLLGHWWLGEEVGPRRFLACIVGFVGTLMVVQPSFAEVGWPALLPLAVAVIFALFTLLTRVLSARIGPMAMQGGASLLVLPLLLAASLVSLPGEPPPLGWVTPAQDELWLLLALALSGAVGHLLIAASLHFAPASTIAPMQYLEIPVATLLGWLIFAQWPNTLAGAGIVLTLAAGLYVLLREGRLSRRAG